MKKFQKVKRAPRLRDTLTRGIRKAESRISDFGLRIADWGLGIGRRVRFKAKGARSIFTSPRRNCRAFTLIELIGVMAIIGILSAVVLPPLISKIEDANSVGEDAKLEEIARALVAGIKASGTIPNPNRTPYNTGTGGGGWGDIAQNYTTLTDDLVNPGTLHYVFPEQDQSARRVYLNDQFITYLVAATGGAVSGVFQTPAAGWPEQAAGLNLANIPLRMYIVSGSKKDLFLNCGENQATAPPQSTPGYGAGLITDLQNWVKTADGPTDPVPGTIPVPDSIAQWGSAYAGGGNYHTRGEFLHVKTVDLRSLFCRVELIDTACPPISTINGGAGYTIGEVITFNVGPYPFSFTAPGGLFSGQSGNLAGNPPQMLGKPFSGSTTADPGNGYRISGLSSGSGASATLSSTPPPRFEINSLGPQLFSLFSTGNVMPPFYLLKSTSLSLLDDTGSVLLTVTIQGDSTFKYFNKTWAKID